MSGQGQTWQRKMLPLSKSETTPPLMTPPTLIIPSQEQRKGFVIPSQEQRKGFVKAKILFNSNLSFY